MELLSSLHRWVNRPGEVRGFSLGPRQPDCSAHIPKDQRHKHPSSPAEIKELFTGLPPSLVCLLSCKGTQHIEIIGRQFQLKVNQTQGNPEKSSHLPMNSGQQKPGTPWFLPSFSSTIPKVWIKSHFPYMMPAQLQASPSTSEPHHLNQLLFRNCDQTMWGNNLSRGFPLAHSFAGSINVDPVGPKPTIWQNIIVVRHMMEVTHLWQTKHRKSREAAPTRDSLAQKSYIISSN